MLVNTIFEEAVERILDVSKRFGAALDAAGISYRIVGGLAVYLHVESIDPLAARLTRDVDVAVSRHDLEMIRQAIEPHGFVYRNVAGVDMFMDKDEPKAKSAVHVIFTGEKVKPAYLTVTPDSEPVRTGAGICICPVEDLVQMKLTSFRLKDKVHIQDLDGVGLITAEIEAGLPLALLERLREVRTLE